MFDYRRVDFGTLPNLRIKNRRSIEEAPQEATNPPTRRRLGNDTSLCRTQLPTSFNMQHWHETSNLNNGSFPQGASFFQNHKPTFLLLSMPSDNLACVWELRFFAVPILITNPFHHMSRLSTSSFGLHFAAFAASTSPRSFFPILTIQETIDGYLPVRVSIWTIHHL